MSAAGGAPEKNAHARFSPSAAERWMTCPASMAVHRQPPSNRYADEGTAAHDLAAEVFNAGGYAHDRIGKVIRVNGADWPVTEDMADAVQVYVDDVRGRINSGDHFFVEQQVSFSSLIGVEEQFGTADCILLSGDGRRVFIGDYKHGMGVKVEARENKQLLTYAAGVVLESFAFLMEDVEEVTVCIYQPRIGHIDEWTFPIARLHEHVEALRLAAKYALKACEYHAGGEGQIPPELFGPSDKACRWCSHFANCTAAQRKVAAAVFDDFQALEDPGKILVGPEPPLPGPNKLGLMFGILDYVEGWARAVRGEVERRLIGGMEVLGPDGLPMKLVEGRKGRRGWQDPKQAEAVLLALLPPDKAYEPQEVISPAKAEKLLGKKATRNQWTDMVEPLIVQAPGSPKVALGSDPSPPWTGSASVDEFPDASDGG